MAQSPSSRYGNRTIEWRSHLGGPVAPPLILLRGHAGGFFLANRNSDLPSNMFAGMGTVGKAYFVTDLVKETVTTSTLPFSTRADPKSRSDWSERGLYPFT